MSSQKSRNKSSLLLNLEENDSIFSQFESGETSLTTAVIQLVLSEPPDHSRWKLFSTGVMCFVKQNRQRTYSFCLYDFDSKEKIWEQEVYLNINYMNVETMFHIFEAEDCVAGLNFADQTEADHFLLIVNQKIIFLRKLFGYNKKAKNEINRNQLKTEMTSLEVPEMPAMRIRSLESVVTTNKFSFSFKSKKSKQKEKQKIDKMEIGMPKNFKHIQHIGWSPTTGFDFNVIDQKLHNFFSSAGISEHQLKDKDTRKFIFDFIDNHGGLETAIKESKKSNQIKRSATISTGLSEVKRNVTKKPMINDQEVMPPPPPPPPPNLDNYRESFLPPTPPPPPIFIENTSDTTDKQYSNPKSMSTDRNSCEQNESNDRNEFLEQIRGGIRLKKTESTKSKSSQNIESSGNTLANDLSKALQNRFRVNQIQNDSSEDSDDSYDEREQTEWRTE